VRVLASVWLLVALALTLSRGGFIGLGVAVAVVLLATRVGMTRWLRYTVAAMIGLAALAATGFIASAVDDFQSRPDNVGQRGTLIGEGLDSLADSYGVGIGLGTYRVEYGEIIHNTAIWFLVEMSIIGVIYFIALCVVPFQSAIRLRPYDRDLALALLGAHVVMVVASVGIEAVYQRNWWVIIGVIGGAGARHAAQMRRAADAVPARSSRR
jgi:O-antigen ligase